MIFRGSGSILLGILYFCDFSGGGGQDPLPPPPPSGPAIGMHLKEGTCLNCSVNIGRKVGLECLFAPDQARRTIFWQSLIAGRKSRESKREREGHTNLVFAWFLRISKTMLGVPQTHSSCASAFVRQSRILHSINALCTFYRIHTFLN